MKYRQYKALDILANTLVTTDRYGDTLTRFKDDWARAEEIFPQRNVPTRVYVKLSKPLFGLTVTGNTIGSLKSLDDFIRLSHT